MPVQNAEGSPLGRIFIPDERDAQFPMEAALKPSGSQEAREYRERGYRYWWADGWWGDQFYTSQCVAYSWLHWIEDGPTTHAPKAPQREAKHDVGALLSPSNVYDRARRVDEWPGENYEGTSVRAGAKVLQSEGLISEYRWTTDVHVLAEAVLTTSPVVVGTWWFEEMFYPTVDGMLQVSGADAGGHAYLVNGVSLKSELFRIKNSWGREWGMGGHAYITFDDMERLLRMDGEACLAVEVPTA